MAAAQVAKLVDALFSGSSAVRCAGSNPVLGTRTPDDTRGFFRLGADANGFAETDK